jgi:hypothetical protein
MAVRAGMAEGDRGFEDRDSERLELEPALRAALIATYQVGERRNTWGGVFLYRANWCFVDREAAEAHVQAHRKSGSSWRIRELPACVFMGERESLVVTDAEVEPPRPLAQHEYDATCRPYLSAIAERFKPRLGSRVRMLTQRTAFKESMRFSEWGSVTNGSEYLLRWTRTDREGRRFDLSAMKSVIEVYRASLSSLAFWGLIQAEGTAGTEIRRLHARSPLLGSGIRPGDVVRQVENVTQEARELSLRTAIASSKPGDQISLRCQGRPDVSFLLQSFEEALRPIECV